MYEEEWDKDLNYEFNKITDKEEIIKIMENYLNSVFNSSDNEDIWFNKIKELSSELGYCPDMKEYKVNPDAYKGNVADISTVIRVAVTTKSQTPDLYEILRLLGVDRIKNRISKI